MRILVVIVAAASTAASAGPFAPAPGQPGSTAIHFSDPRVVGWATAVASLDRGPVDIGVPEGARASHGEAGDALGAATEDVYDVVSLGDGGAITLTFAAPIADRPGADFAVFENGFDDGFIELAFVEVSSDGSQFHRFPAESLTPVDAQVGGFDFLDPTDVHQVAGKYRAGYGVPFDLSDLAGLAGLDVGAVTHIRIVDAIGTLDPLTGSRDSAGRLVNDPYPTNFTTGGFDLDGVAVLAPEPRTYADWVAAVFPVDRIALAAPDLDPDHDGWTNLEECAFNGEPLRAGGRAPLSVDVSGGRLALAFERLPWQRDIAYAVELSADLASWTEVARGERGAGVTASVPGIAIVEAPGIEAVATTVSAPAGAWRFARVRVILLP